jgi:hypothetical protein
MTANVTANRVVNAMIAPSLARGFDTKYRMKMEKAGRRDERTVLMALATAAKVSSLYSHSPASLSPEIGF